MLNLLDRPLELPAVLRVLAGFREVGVELLQTRILVAMP